MCPIPGRLFFLKQTQTQFEVTTHMLENLLLVAAVILLTSHFCAIAAGITEGIIAKKIAYYKAKSTANFAMLRSPPGREATRRW